MKPDLERAARVACGLGLLAFAWVLLRTAWLSDDAYISFRVVENALGGHGLRWNIAERVQVFTHPLWMLLHLPLRALTGEIYYTSLAFSGLLSLGVVFVLVRRVASTAGAGLLVVVPVLGSKAFVDYSTSGLENPLTHLLLVGLFLVSLRGDSERTLLLQAGIAGLLAWNRLDTVLFAAPLLALGAWRIGPARSWRPLLAGFAPALAWFAFAFVYYGHPFPNTAFAKLGAGTGFVELAGLGLRYVAASLRDDPLTLATVAVALVAAVARRRHLGIGLGIALYLLYVLRIGGDFMGGRFFSAPFVLALAILAAETSRAMSRRVVGALGLAVLAGLLAGAVPLASGTRYGLDRERLIDDYGVADERAYYFRKSGLWNGKPTTLVHDDKWFEATTARNCGFPLLLAGAIGFYGYTAGPDLHIVDYNALADPVLSRLPAVENDPLYRDWFRRLEGREPATQRRIGHFLRNIPPGYAARLLGDATRFEDDAMERHVETVLRATRDPLFSSDRLAAVGDLLFGGTTDTFEGPGFRRFRPMPIGEILAVSGDPVFTSTLRGCGLSQPDPAAALPWLEAATAGCRDNGLAWKCLGDAHERLGQADRELAARRRVVELAPGAEWALADLEEAGTR